MAIDISITHPFVSEKADGPDATLIQPSNWNEEHAATITVGAERLLGRSANNSGEMQEIPLGDGLGWNAGALRCTLQITADAMTGVVPITKGGTGAITAPLARTALGLTAVATYAKATNAEVWSAAADKVITTDLLESAGGFVVVTDAATITLDWDAGVNFQVTLAGNRTLANPTNAQPGTWRILRVIQGTGGNKLISSWGTRFQHPYGVKPSLATAAGAHDILQLFCVTTNLIVVTHIPDLRT